MSDISSSGNGTPVSGVEDGGFLGVGWYGGGHCWSSMNW